MILTARTENDPDAPGCFRVVLNHDGPIVLAGESYQVCSNVADALCNPDRWIGTECGEVAEAIRGQRT